VVFHRLYIGEIDTWEWDFGGLEGEHGAVPGSCLTHGKGLPRRPHHDLIKLVCQPAGL